MTNVVIVDNDWSFCERLQEELSKAVSIHVGAVHRSGEEALQHIPRREPDVVLMDIKLTGSNACAASAQSPRPSLRRC